jgi:uncharacterized membrane protein
MTTHIVLQTLVFLHLIALVIFAGTTIVDFVTFNQFWKEYHQNKARAMVLMQAKANFPLLMKAGMVLIILSGVGMMVVTKGIYGEQLWLRIKFGLVILLLLNSMLIGRRLLLKLRKDLAEDGNSLPAMTKLKDKIRRFHYGQLVLLFVIVLLAVFRFN